MRRDSYIKCGNDMEITLGNDSKKMSGERKVPRFFYFARNDKKTRGG